MARLVPLSGRRQKIFARQRPGEWDRRGLAIRILEFLMAIQRTNAPANPSVSRQVEVDTPAVQETTTVAATTTPNTASGLDGATESGNAPSALNQVLGGVNAGAGRLLGQLASQGFQSRGTKDVFGLVPGRVPNAVGLDVVLQGIAASPDGQAAIAQLANQISRQTGMAIPPALVAAAQANPDRVADMLQFTPQEMSLGMGALNQAHKAGKIDDVAPLKTLLPQKFSFDDIGAVAFERKDPTIKELAPGLFQGGLKNDALSDDQAKVNTVVAEVFQRLAGNAEVDPKARFQVEFAGHKCTRVDTFVKALRKEGYSVDVSFEHRVANFSELMTKAPNGQWLDVPAPLMVKVQDEQQKNLGVVPSVHSEVVFSIRSGANSKGPKLDSNVKWYQGISGTGFFPVGLNKTPAWCGGKTTDTLSGKEADKALGLCALMGDVINKSASKLDLMASGYGVTGVCNDSVAIIHHATCGEAKEFPLLMQDATLMGELERRMSDDNHRDDPGYSTLKASVIAVPSDTSANSSSVSRAIDCMPWEAGKAPFQSSEQFLSAATQA